MQSLAGKGPETQVTHPFANSASLVNFCRNATIRPPRCVTEGHERAGMCCMVLKPLSISSYSATFVGTQVGGEHVERAAVSQNFESGNG